MRIILSRKGFDTGNGGMPSPILPDGSMLSLPINSKTDSIKYSELFHDGKTYMNIIQELSPNRKFKENWTCHLDPDINRNSRSRQENWVGVFGQHDAAQGHLKNQGITRGDLFLFFGLFRKTEFRNGQLKFMRHAPKIHVFFGYLLIDQIVTNKSTVPVFASDHPHVKDWDRYGKNNALYTASSNLPWDHTLPGYGIFRFSNDLILTKEGYSSSRWELPAFFKDLHLSYHTKASHRVDYFQSAGRGQEFVLEESDHATLWARSLIQKGLNP